VSATAALITAAPATTAPASDRRGFAPSARRLLIPVVLAVAAAWGIGASPADAASTDSVVPAAAKAPGVKSGIDVSHWQPRIDWPRVARSGIDFAIAKATEGTNFVDETYARNARQARAAGIRFTAYHFARPGRSLRSARRQADFFVRHARLKPQDLVPALDLERSGGLSSARLEHWVLAFLHRVERRLHVKPMVYTSPGFWKGNMADSRAIVRAGYRVLWVAHYGTRRPEVPASRWNGHGWTIWQWTKCGQVSGITGCVDRDALSGVRLRDLTIAALRTRR
jgi:lysozyme